MIKNYIVQNIEDFTPVIHDLIDSLDLIGTFLLTGDLGAGKTTLVKEWMRALKVSDEVTSPTFSLINEYRKEDLSIFHMDMYRLKDLDEAINIGIEEYLYDDKAICIIEWPELILPLIDHDHVHIQIGLVGKTRVVTITKQTV